MNHSNADNIHVRIASRPELTYNVHIGPGTLSTLGAVAQQTTHASRALLIADDNLPEHTVQHAIDTLNKAGIDTRTATITATETNKSLATAAALLAQAADARLSRKDLVVGLGGGITTDIAGFVAATYQRGVAVIQCPTTLLAMVDASVGGKTGVNLKRNDGTTLKNYAGAFFQPAAVIADTDTLDSLHDRHLRSGLAEYIKHALLAKGFNAQERTPEQLPQTIAAAVARDHTELARIAAEGVRVKAAVVKADESELSEDPSVSRAILNLGHTFAHAIEPLPSLSPTANQSDAPLTHGEAVALGLIAAATAAQHLGLIAQHHNDQIHALIHAASLPTRVAHLPPNDDLIDRMTADKKAHAGGIRLILPDARTADALGTCTIVDASPIDAIQAGWDAIRAEHSH